MECRFESYHRYQVFHLKFIRMIACHRSVTASVLGLGLLWTGAVVAAPPDFLARDFGMEADSVLQSCLKRVSKDQVSSKDGRAGICYDAAAKYWGYQLRNTLRALDVELDSAGREALDASQEIWDKQHEADDALWRAVLKRKQTPAYEMTIMAQRRYVRIRLRTVELERLLADAKYDRD